MIKFGIDGYDFVKSIPDEVWPIIDTVVWDPPYFDAGNKEDEERVNGRTKMKKDACVPWNNPAVRLMDPVLRKKIFDYIKSRIKPDTYIIHFHSQEERLQHLDNIACKHAWVKPINITIAGNADRNNGEHIYVQGTKIKGKPKGQILNKYITLPGPMRKAKNGSTKLARSAAKPKELLSELFRHLKSTCILDPFAGYGASIAAAYGRGAQIFACDLDPWVRFSPYWQNAELGDYFE